MKADRMIREWAEEACHSQVIGDLGLTKKWDILEGEDRWTEGDRIQPCGNYLMKGPKEISTADSRNEKEESAEKKWLLGQDAQEGQIEPQWDEEGWEGSVIICKK